MPDYVVELIRHPTEDDWMEAKRRTLVTIGKRAVNPPSPEWKRAILNARHSPIRYLMFGFYLEIPYWVSVHFCRHVHAQPYVSTQRNDRQDKYDRNAARQDETVKMILDVNAEQLMVMANKRLCGAASPETRAVMEKMRRLVGESNPEFSEFLVPMCGYHGGVCHEIKCCGRNSMYRGR